MLNRRCCLTHADIKGPLFISFLTTIVQQASTDRGLLLPDLLSRTGILYIDYLYQSFVVKVLYGQTCRLGQHLQRRAES